MGTTTLAIPDPEPIPEGPVPINVPEPTPDVAAIAALAVTTWLAIRRKAVASQAASFGGRSRHERSIP